MDDLISRKSALDVLHGYFDGMLETGTCSPQDLYNLFEIIPSAQPDFDMIVKIDTAYDDGYKHGYDQARFDYAQLERPEIIDCGNCKHWIRHDKRCGYWNHGVEPLDWCSHAERRTDERFNQQESGRI